ncbi:MAG: hypothetical protein LW875_07605 [Proteobacteria bacterium]|jgi:hypothetical protein|nr:hypothetical protein [Pseudomonadota bacterium]
MKNMILVLSLALAPQMSSAQETGKACANFAAHGFASKAEVTKFWNEVKLKASKSDLDGLQITVLNLFAVK